MIIHSELAANSELKIILDENPDVFSKSRWEYEDVVIITYLVYHRSLGESSPWYHFIECLPDNPSILQDWEDDYVD